MKETRPGGQASASSWVEKIGKIVYHPAFQHTIIGLILLNAIIVGMETYPHLYQPYQSWFFLADRILLWLFTVEIILRLIATRPTLHFFKDSWNLFDFVIIAAGHIFVGAHFVTVLRILRVLRVLRAITVIPSLRRLVNALLMTIPALGNISLLLGLIFYIFGVIGTMLYADVAPEYFGSLHLSLITLFQVVTLESWASGVMRPIMAEADWAWTYFVSFILVGTFVIFNLFVGVIVNNVEKVDQMEAGDLEAHLEFKDSVGDKDRKISKDELGQLRAEIAELKEMIRKQQEHGPPPKND